MLSRHEARAAGAAGAGVSGEVIGSLVADSKTVIARLDVQPGDMTDGCSETWLTRQNWQDSSNKGASHAVARGVCHGPATRVRNACQAGWSKPAEAVPAVQHQCPDRIQVD